MLALSLHFILSATQGTVPDPLGEALTGPAPLYEAYLREEAFKLPGTERIEALKFSPHNSLALTAYWLDVCAATKRHADYHKGEVPLDRDKLPEFVGFLHGRLLHPLHREWLAALKSARVSRDYAMSFPSVDNLTVQRHACGIKSNPGVSVAREGDKLLITQGQDRVVVSEAKLRRALSPDSSLPIDFLDVHFGPGATTVAVTAYNAASGAVTRVARDGETVWASAAFGDFLPVRNGPQMEVKYAIRVTEADGRAVLYVLHPRALFLEEFDLPPATPGCGSPPPSTGASTSVSSCATDPPGRASGAVARPDRACCTHESLQRSARALSHALRGYPQGSYLAVLVRDEEC